MPTYEYVCKSCGETMDVYQSFSDKPLKKHKGCGGELKKVFHARGIVFKGGGFYATDSRPATSTKSSDEKTGKKSEKSNTAAKAETSTSKAATSKSDD